VKWLKAIIASAGPPSNVSSSKRVGFGKEKLVKRTLQFWIAMAVGLCVAPVLAQDWPQRPVRLVVPYAAGGNVDVGARIVATRLQELLGQPFVIENKPGAGGLTAADYVAKAAPDGYTIFVGANGPLLFMPVITGRAGYDWKKEFEAVGALSFTPLVLQVRPALGVRSVKDFVELAKRKDLNMGSGGAGSTNHLSSELLQSLSGTRWTTVHYKGNAPVIAALLSGEVDFSIEQVSVAMPMLKDGRVVPVAVTSRSRFPLMPDVPTFDESGYKGFEAVTWIGFFAPAGTPAPVVARFNAALNKAVVEPAIAKRFTDMGSETRAMSPEAFGDYVRSENAKWTPIVKQANIKAE
jgi:tripartite-type tricarboxylate transporter receptor subunit TctC